MVDARPVLPAKSSVWVLPLVVLGTPAEGPQFRFVLQFPLAPPPSQMKAWACARAARSTNTPTIASAAIGSWRLKWIGKPVIMSPTGGRDIVGRFRVIHKKGYSVRQNHNQ